MLGARLINKARRSSATSAEAVLGADQRPPVLYLRAFGDDDRTCAGVTRGVAWGAGALITEEAQLAAAVVAIGPLLAVGRPGEGLPELGAARLYVGDDWQQRVSNLMRDAELVIVRLAQTRQGVLTVPLDRRSITSMLLS